jgi:uncharacterized membrane protein
MIFPLGVWELGLLFAVIALVLLVTSELLSPHHRKPNILINKKKLQNTAIFFSILFLATIAIRIISAIFGL